MPNILRAARRLARKLGVMHACKPESAHEGPPASPSLANLWPTERTPVIERGVGALQVTDRPSPREAVPLIGETAAEHGPETPTFTLTPSTEEEKAVLALAYECMDELGIPPAALEGVQVGSFASLDADGEEHLGCTLAKQGDELRFAIAISDLCPREAYPEVVRHEVLHMLFVLEGEEALVILAEQALSIIKRIRSLPRYGVGIYPVREDEGPFVLFEDLNNAFQAVPPVEESVVDG